MPTLEVPQPVEPATPIAPEPVGPEITPVPDEAPTPVEPGGPAVVPDPAPGPVEVPDVAQ